MKTYRTAEFISPSPCVTALGCFDGVHIGHAKLICEAKAIADKMNIQTAVWSFSEPPKNYFQPGSVSVITSCDEKRIALQRLGVDIMISVPFNKEIFNLSAEDFFKDVLISKMNSKHIVCGFNYRFGKGGAGNTDLLRSLCESYGIGLTVIPRVTVDGITVSSSEIRTAIECGKLELAERLLGRPYSLRAKVIDGKHLGHTIGFPTLNQEFKNGKTVPLYGVYLSRIKVGKTSKYGITNVGTQPTINANQLYAETHIFDFCADIYGRTVTVEFLHFLRTEQRFDGIEVLKEQISKDVKKAKDILKK